MIKLKSWWWRKIRLKINWCRSRSSSARCFIRSTLPTELLHLSYIRSLLSHVEVETGEKTTNLWRQSRDASISSSMFRWIRTKLGFSNSEDVCELIFKNTTIICQVSTTRWRSCVSKLNLSDGSRRWSLWADSFCNIQLAPSSSWSWDQHLINYSQRVLIRIIKSLINDLILEQIRRFLHQSSSSSSSHLGSSKSCRWRHNVFPLQRRYRSRPFWGDHFNHPPPPPLTSYFLVDPLHRATDDVIVWDAARKRIGRKEDERFYWRSDVGRVFCSAP